MLHKRQIPCYFFAFWGEYWPVTGYELSPMGRRISCCKVRGVDVIVRRPVTGGLTQRNRLHRVHDILRGLGFPAGKRAASMPAPGQCASATIALAMEKTG
jgi:hypothetical protein